MGRRSIYIVAGALAAAVAIVLLASLPPAARDLPAPADAGLAARTVRGAFHVHTTRSDGAADKASVAAAARRAGLQFVVITDHGDGTRLSDPPEYINGVLCLDGVEISTSAGHYISLGAEVSPYPLGGESSGVVEDVARLGGFGIAAHPESQRRELAWADWTLPLNAVEWLNADSEWRDETRWTLARAVAGYAVRPAGALASLLDRPESTLARWDSAAATRRTLAIAGHDAHGGIGAREEQPTGRRIRVPSYESSFRAFSTRVEMDRPFTGDATADGAALLASISAGRFYSAIDAVASGVTTLAFDARSAEGSARQGSVLPGGGTASFSARATVPEGVAIVAFRNGSDIARSTGGALDFQSAALGAYRIEVHAPGAPGRPPVPWLVSNPIFRLPPATPVEPPARSPVLTVPASAWRIEKEEGSDGTARGSAGSGEVHFSYRLRAGERVSQFVALVADLPRDLPPFDAVAFTARSTPPRRVSVQLRFAGDGDARWARSVFIGSSARRAIVDVADLRRADGPDRRPAAQRATSVLFVADLTNARPGDAATLHLQEVALARSVSPVLRPAR